MNSAGTSHVTPTSWRIDPKRSALRFTARQIGMSIRGRFPEIDGTVDFRVDRLEESSVEAVVRTGSVEPAMPALRGLLLSDAFLAAQTYPEVRFRSGRIEPDGDRYLVHGELTFRGERRAVAFETRLAEIDVLGEHRSARIQARARVDRLISDEELEIELELTLVPAVSTMTPPQRVARVDAEQLPALTAVRAGVPDAGPDAMERVDHRDRSVHIVALVGSFRRSSLNRALLRAAQDTAPDGVTIEQFSLADVPFYDGDMEVDGDPASVRALKAAIVEADALLIVTPEYNRGLPAVTKNAIDWASRPPFASPLAGKHVLLMGATTGRSATKYALQQAADALAHAQATPFERRFGLARAGQLIDDDGRLSDPTIRADLRQLLTEFSTTVRRAARSTSNYYKAA